MASTSAPKPPPLERHLSISAVINVFTLRNGLEMLKMIPAKSGCFCCSLRTCVLVQGWVYSVSSSVFVILTLGMFAFVDAVYNNGDHTPERRKVWSLSTAVLYIIFVIGFLWAAVQYTMLVGIYKKRAWMLVPHLVLTACSTLGISIAGLVNLQTGIITSIAIAVFICIETYFWFHVFFYYQELKRTALTIAPEPKPV